MAQHQARQPEYSDIRTLNKADQQQWVGCQMDGQGGAGRGGGLKHANRLSLGKQLP